jgi:excisionase family DNA binding protein
MTREAPIAAGGQIAGRDTRHANPVTLPRRCGDVRDVAHLMKVSPKTVRRQADLKKIPGIVRVGRLLRFDLDQIHEWIDQGAPPLSRFDRNRDGRTLRPSRG